MTVELSNFGDGTNLVGDQVHTVFNGTDVGPIVGRLPGHGQTKELVFQLNDSMLLADDFSMSDPVLPAGSIVEGVTLTTTDVWVGGAGVLLDIGTAGSEATNGSTFTEVAHLETLGAFTVTCTGTWAPGLVLAADTTVGIALSVSTATGGAGFVTIKYRQDRT